MGVKGFILPKQTTLTATARPQTTQKANTLHTHTSQHITPLLPLVPHHSLTRSRSCCPSPSLPRTSRKPHHHPSPKSRRRPPHHRRSHYRSHCRSHPRTPHPQTPRPHLSRLTRTPSLPRPPPPHLNRCLGFPPRLTHFPPHPPRPTCRSTHCPQNHRCPCRFRRHRRPIPLTASCLWGRH